MEVTKDDNNNNVFRLRRRNVMEMLNAEKEANAWPVEELWTRRRHFRMARVHNKRIHYNVTWFNISRACWSSHRVFKASLHQDLVAGDPPFPSSPQVLPTGVTLLCQEGQVELMDVTKDGNIFRLRKRNVMEMMTAEKETKMFLDNTCLARRRALDTKKTLFCLARVHKSIHYNLTV